VVYNHGRRGAVLRARRRPPTMRSGVTPFVFGAAGGCSSCFAVLTLRPRGASLPPGARAARPCSPATALQTSSGASLRAGAILLDLRDPDWRSPPSTADELPSPRFWGAAGPGGTRGGRGRDPAIIVRGSPSPNVHGPHGRPGSGGLINFRRGIDIVPPGSRVRRARAWQLVFKPVEGAGPRSTLGSSPTWRNVVFRPSRSRGRRGPATGLEAFVGPWPARVRIGRRGSCGGLGRWRAPRRWLFLYVGVSFVVALGPGRLARWRTATTALGGRLSGRSAARRGLGV